jgi:hypothetical protein
MHGRSKKRTASSAAAATSGQGAANFIEASDFSGTNRGADTILFMMRRQSICALEMAMWTVEPCVWNDEVSGKQVLLQWFRYRKADR